MSRVEYPVTLLLDHSCQVFCDGECLCDAPRLYLRLMLSEGNHSFDYIIEGQTILSEDYYVRPDSPQKRRISRVHRVKLHDIYIRICEEKEALSQGKSLVEELNNQGFSLYSIRLEQMCAVLPEGEFNDYEDDWGYDFVKAIVEYGPPYDCELDCPYDHKMSGRGRSMREHGAINKCAEQHPEIKCRLGRNFKIKVFYPFFRCSQGQFDEIESKGKDRSFNDLIIYKNRWVKATSESGVFIPQGKHYDSFKEFVVEYTCKPVKTYIDLDWIEEHGWDDD